MTEAQRPAWFDGWLVRLRSEVPLWWTGEADTWTELPHALWWATEADAVVAVLEQLGPFWHERATLQPCTAGADEYALWFAECWTEACQRSGLAPLEACAARPHLLVARFTRGIMARPGAPRMRLTAEWASTAQAWATWALERRVRLLADLEQPPSTT